MTRDDAIEAGHTHSNRPSTRYSLWRVIKERCEEPVQSFSLIAIGVTGIASELLADPIWIAGVASGLVCIIVGIAVATGSVSFDAAE